MKFKHVFPFFACISLFSQSNLLAADCWISPLGSGLKNGSSAVNSYSAKKAQTCWEKTSADGVMHVLPGEYSAAKKTFWTLAITSKNDGSQSSNASSYKKIIGQGKVIVQGTRPVPYSVSEKGVGGRWITITRGAKNIWIQNFSVSRVEEGIVAKEGSNSHMLFSDLSFEDTRLNITLIGHPKCVKQADCRVKSNEKTHDVIIKNTSGKRYSKRHIRLSKGVHKIRVLHSHADGGSLDGDFAVGFDVENPSSDIEFSHCSSRNNIYTLSPYWNGDGFKTENETSNIRWSHCSAAGNADAGFDIKTKNAVLEDIIAVRNSRNIRIWSSEKAILKNINASYSHQLGGISTGAGIWSQGKLECHHCTLHNNLVQAHAEDDATGAEMIFYDSILSMDPDHQGEILKKESKSKIDLIRTATWHASSKDPDPKYAKTDLSQWEGGKEFNSLLYGKTKGYYED